MIADKQDGSQVQIGYDGKVLNENIYSGVTILEYDSFEKRKMEGRRLRNRQDYIVIVCTIAMV